MTILNTTVASFAAILIIIIVGIVTEKKKVDWANAFGNLLSFVVILGTVDMSREIAILMFFYMICGIFVVYYKVRNAYVFFGYKTYGALSLVLLLANLQLFGLSLTSNNSDMTIKLLIAWLFFSLIIHVIGLIYARK